MIAAAPPAGACQNRCCKGHSTGTLEHSCDHLVARLGRLSARVAQICKMVFIGKNLDKDALRKGLEAARAK